MVSKITTLEPAEPDRAPLDQQYVEREHPDKTKPLAQHQAPALDGLGSNGVNRSRGDLARQGVARSKHGHERGHHASRIEHHHGHHANGFANTDFGLRGRILENEMKGGPEETQEGEAGK